MAPLESSKIEVTPNAYEVSFELSPLKVNEDHTQSKERRLFFGCLDIFTIWSPGNPSHSGSTIADTESIICSNPSQSNDMTESTQQGKPQQIADKQVCEGQVVYASCNLDEYLAVEPNIDNEIDSHCQLSLSYSSFSEEDHAEEDRVHTEIQAPQENIVGSISNTNLLTIATEEKADEASAGSDSSLSFDPDDFLEDNDAACERILEPRLDTIAESFEEYQARSQRLLNYL